ncbi:MAG: universal stress protein [Methanoculleaceae archaeon]
MGYYASLIRRKFRGVVGSRYQTVMQEYRQFLPAEEEMVVQEIERILMPLDYYVRSIPEEYYEVLSAYRGSVILVYIIDSRTLDIIRQTLGEDDAAEFRRNKEKYGEMLLREVSERISSLGLIPESRLFVGDKIDDVCRISQYADLLALSRNYGGFRNSLTTMAPITLTLCHEAGIPILLY